MLNPRTLGRHTAQAQARITDEAAFIRKAEERLFGEPLLSAERSVERRRRHLLVAASIIGLMLLSAAVLIPRLAPPPPLTARIDGLETDITKQLSVQTPVSDERSIVFSDGSLIRLARATRTHFVDVSSGGADMRVEQGTLIADITHTQKTRWRFLAGPFAVRVTGTRFTLDWDREDGIFSVAMDEGSVEITSADGRPEPRRVSGGETFVAWTHENRTALVPNRPATEVHRDETVAALSETSATDETEGAVASDISTDEESPNVERSEDAAGRTPRAPTRICRESDAKQLLDSADRARRGGDWRAAADAYELVRTCFRRTPESTLAAFNLGKIAFDRRRDWSDAIHWLKVYLDEQRGEGPVRESMGRLMEAYMRAGQPGSARAIARRYLENYPSGPHAGYAESLIEEDTDTRAHR